MRHALFVLAAIAPLALAQPGSAPDARQAAVIDWKAYQAALKEARPRVERTRSANIGREIKKTRLPVLLATHEDVRAEPEFLSQGTAYVAHYRPDADIDIVVLGSASHLVANGAGGLAAPASSDDTFEVLEDVTDLSFSRFGASYTIRASCGKEDDLRCKDRTYLTKFKDSLIPVAR